MMPTYFGKHYPPIPVDTETPYLAIGGTVFGPHDGQIRRSFILAFAGGSEGESKDANQRLAKTLAERLSADPGIAQSNPSLEQVEHFARKHARAVMIECGGQFQFNKLIFDWIEGNGVIF
jgi:hypothetical protein